MFDESEYGGSTKLSEGERISHFQSVLAPRSEDTAFLLSLPEPRPFGEFLDQTREYLSKYPSALIGEVGLDKSFRIPEAWLPESLEKRDDALTPGGREGRHLSPYRVSMEHQRKVLLAQLRLAGELQRAVSVHGVQAHGVLYDTLAATWKGHERHVQSRKERRGDEAIARANAAPLDDKSDTQDLSGSRPFPPRVCLHSFSGPAETVKQYIAPSVPCDVFFSFSTTVNAWSDTGDGKVEAAARAVPDDRLLVESDLHTAGERMDHYLEDIVRKVCAIKKWNLEAGVARLGQNWRRFVSGQG